MVGSLTNHTTLDLRLSGLALTRQSVCTPVLAETENAHVIFCMSRRYFKQDTRRPPAVFILPCPVADKGSLDLIRQRSGQI